MISTQACATRDADGNAPLHFALVRCAAPRSSTCSCAPGACSQRGFLGRLPLQLASLRRGPLHAQSNGRLPRRRRLRQAGHHAAHDASPHPAVEAQGAAARRPSKRVARTVTPPDLHNVVPPFDDDYDALGLGAGCGWLTTSSTRATRSNRRTRSPEDLGSTRSRRAARRRASTRRCARPTASRARAASSACSSRGSSRPRRRRAPCACRRRRRRGPSRAGDGPSLRLSVLPPAPRPRRGSAPGANPDSFSIRRPVALVPCPRWRMGPGFEDCGGSLPRTPLARGPRRRKLWYPIVAAVSRALDAAEKSHTSSE